MAAPGRAISFAMANRWAFESLGRGLHVDAGRVPMPSYADAFTGSVLTGCAVLASLAIVFVVATVGVLASRTRRW
jgi:hypothetical protein